MNKKVLNPKLLASVQLGFCLLIGVAYLFQKDFRRGLYWLFAAGITGTVTF